MIPRIRQRIREIVSGRFLEICILLFLAFIAVAYVRNVVFTPGLPAVFDWAIPPDRSQLIYSFEDASYAWRYLGVFTGAPNSPLWASTMVWNAIGYIAAQIGLDGITYAKVALIFVIFAGGVSSYFLLRVLKSSRMASFIGCILYISAPIFFNWLTMQGSQGITVIYSCLPATIALFLKANSDGKHWLRYSILAALLMSNVYPVISAALSMMILVPYAIFTVIRSRSKNIAFSMLRIFAVMIFLFICLQFYWVILMFGTGQAAASLTSQHLLGQSSWAYSLTDVFKMWGFYVNAYEGVYQSIGLPGFIGLLIPVLAFSALLINSKVRWTSVFFSSIAVIGIFLIGTPQGVALIDGNYFLLGVFADRAKLFLLISLSYSVLIADLIDKVRKKASKPMAITQMVSIVLLISIIAAPFVAGSLGNQFIDNRSFSKTYVSTQDWLGQQEGDFKVLWLPTGSNFVTEATYTKSWTGDFYGIYSPVPGVVYDVSHRYILVPQFWLTSQFYKAPTENTSLSKILALFNVKYLIYRPNCSITNWATVGDSPAWGLNTGIIGQVLSNQTNLEQIINNGDVQVYLNKENLEHIYAVPTVDMISGDLASLERLAIYPNSTFANRVFLFASQLPDTNAFERASTIFIQDNNFFDLLLPFLNDSLIVDPGEFTNPPPNTATDGWANLHQWYWALSSQAGLENSAVTFCENATMEIPINIKQTQNYQIWAKTLLGNTTSAITFNLSNKTWSTQSAITTYSPVESGFRWIQIGNESKQLAEGPYTLSMTSSGQQNTAARIVIPSSSDMDEATVKLNQYLSERSIDLTNKIHGNTTIYIPVDGNYEFNFHSTENGNLKTAISVDPSRKIKVEITGGSLSPSTINPSFEAGIQTPYFWTGKSFGGYETTFIWDHNVSHSGKYSVSFRSSNTSQAAWISDPVQVTPSKLYEFGGWLKTESLQQLSGGGVNLVIKFYDSNGTYISETESPYIYGTNKWQYLSMKATAPPNATTAKLLFQKYQSFGTAWVDDITWQEEAPQNFQWSEAGKAYLQQGYYNITLDGINPAKIDMLRLSLSNRNAEDTAPELKFEKISPTEYRVHVNASQPFSLTFSESYDPQWKAYFGDVNWFETLWKAPISEEQHFLVNSYANAWYIDKIGEYDLTITFFPQSLLYMGEIISLSTLALCLSYLSKDGVKYLYVRFIRKKRHFSEKIGDGLR